MGQENDQSDNERCQRSNKNGSGHHIFYYFDVRVDTWLQHIQEPFKGSIEKFESQNRTDKKKHDRTFNGRQREKQGQHHHDNSDDKFDLKIPFFTERIAESGYGMRKTFLKGTPQMNQGHNFILRTNELVRYRVLDSKHLFAMVMSHEMKYSVRKNEYKLLFP